MDMMEIAKLIKTHEGFESKPYQCPAGKTTIGYGRNLDDVGITEGEARILMMNDIANAITDLTSIFTDKWPHFPLSVRYALADMRYNLGPRGFRTFKKMIAALENFDYIQAAYEMWDSKWRRQVGKRAERLMEIMREAAE